MESEPTLSEGGSEGGVSSIMLTVSIEKRADFAGTGSVPGEGEKEGIVSDEIVCF